MKFRNTKKDKIMNIKNISSLMIVGLGLCFTTIGMNPAHSSEIVENKEEVLISQLRGHDTYKSDGNGQIDWSNYSLGRVISKSGSITWVRMEDGTVFHQNSGVRAGSDVLVGRNQDGDYYIVRAAESEWISRLESDYGWQRNTYAETTISERTASIWREIESDSTVTATQVLGTEGVQTQEYTPAVRGLW